MQQRRAYENCFAAFLIAHYPFESVEAFSLFKICQVRLSEAIFCDRRRWKCQFAKMMLLDADNLRNVFLQRKFPPHAAHDSSLERRRRRLHLLYSRRTLHHRA